MIRFEDLKRDDYASNPLLNDFDDELGVDNVTRDSGHSNSSDCFTHAVNVRSRKFPRSVLQAGEF